MIRKAAALVLMVFYLVLSIGVNLNVHFCGGNLKSVSVSSEGSKCCCDSEEKSNKCCSDKSVFVQYDTDEKQVSSFRFELGKLSFEIRNWMATDTAVTEVSKTKHHEYGKAPPPKKPLWLRHCSLTYYG